MEGAKPTSHKRVSLHKTRNAVSSVIYHSLAVDERSMR